MGQYESKLDQRCLRVPGALTVLKGDEQVLFNPLPISWADYAHQISKLVLNKMFYIPWP